MVLQMRHETVIVLCAFPGAPLASKQSVRHLLLGAPGRLYTHDLRRLPHVAGMRERKPLSAFK